MVTTRQFTTRRLIIVVLMAALALAASRSVPSILNELRSIIHDDPYHSIRRVANRWDLGREPSITVDLFQGTISVLPSADGIVDVQLGCVAVTKESQSAADDGVNSIKLGFHQQGDLLRITANQNSTHKVTYESWLTLSVPPNVALNLRTGSGSVYIGRDYGASRAVIHRPISARSIRVRNDSEYQLGQGNIVVESLALQRVGLAPSSTRLQLEACGLIDVVAELASVEAHAWHGVPPRGWTTADYEGSGRSEGSITFEGSLAEGAHSLRAAHLIDLKLPPSSSVAIDAEAVKGPIDGDLLPGQVGPTEGRARRKGEPGGREVSEQGAARAFA